MDLFVRVIVLEHRSSRCKGWNMARFCGILIDALQIELSMIPELEQRIQALSLERLPCHRPNGRHWRRPTSLGIDVHMVLGVDAWEDAAAVGRGILKSVQQSKDDIHIPTYLQEQFREREQVYSRRRSYPFEMPGWLDIVSALHFLQRCSLLQHFRCMQPASRAVLRKWESSPLKEIDVASPTIWAEFCPGGFKELQQHRLRLSHSNQGCADRFIVDSGGGVGRTWANVLRGDFVCGFASRKEAFIMRRCPSNDIEFEVIGFACVRPKYIFSSVCKSGAVWDLDFVLDPVDLLRVGMWWHESKAVLDDENQSEAASETSAIEKEGYCIRNGIRF